MTKVRAQLVTCFLILATIFSCQCAPSAVVPTRTEPVEFWEPIMFRIIDRTTRLSNLQPLRETALRPDDFEVRIWRGFGLENLEGVVIRRIDGQWSGTHIVAYDHSEPNKTVLARLHVPKSGWIGLWAELSNLGLLTLPGNVDETCRGRLDGNAHAVEVSYDGSYRTYFYPSYLPRCTGSDRMDLISETIGIEFDDGTGECREAEWFPCASVLRDRRLGLPRIPHP